MTVIAYKDGILVTDTATFGDEMIVGYARKIYVDEYFVWAACGSLPEVAAFRKWATESFADNLRPPKSDNFGAVVVYRDGRIFKVGETFILYDVTQYKAPVVDGAAREFMLGVMWASFRGAPEAVEAAIERSVWAGGTTDIFDCREWKFLT
jgi:hypothetical protein